MIPDFPAISELLKLITIAASVTAAIRIITYRRDGKFKRHFSVVAWALAFLMCAQAINVALVSSASPTFYQAGIALIVSFALIRCKGNISCLFNGGQH